MGVMGMEEDGAVEGEVDLGVGEDFEEALGGEAGMVGAGETSGDIMHYLAQGKEESCMDGQLEQKFLDASCGCFFCRYPPCLWYLRAVAPKWKQRCPN